MLFKREKHWKLWACSGANDPPIINNLNTELYVREDEAVGTNVLPLAAYDKTSNPSLTYTVSTVPSTASDLFHIVGQYVVVLSLCIVSIGMMSLCIVSIGMTSLCIASIGMTSLCIVSIGMASLCIVSI